MAAEHSSVTLFREYLRIKTVHPKPDYQGAKEFLQKVAEDIGLEFRTYELVAGKPIVVMTWRGRDETLSSLLLTSHIDVVPVEISRWTHDPFAADKDEKGNIYARGTQDMKCVGIQHIEAVRRLKKLNNKQPPLRTIHLSFLPDEEIGGHDGMEKFVDTQDFRELNVGFALDEGLAHPGEEMIVYYGERASWWLLLTATGPTGHGSQLFPQTAGDSLLQFLSRLTKWREEESLKLRSDSKKRLGDVTTINVNMIKTGTFAPDGTFQVNVIPSEAKAAVDMRVDPSVNLKELKAKLDSWCSELGLTLNFHQTPLYENFTTSTDETKNLWWASFSSTLKQLDVEIETQIFPAATDSRYLRAKGLQAIGFSPMNNTPILLHDHDEFLNETIFLRGVDIMEALVRNLSELSHK
jgi:aminoacylase